MGFRNKRVLFTGLYVVAAAFLTHVPAVQAQEAGKGSEADIAGIQQAFAEFSQNFSKQDAGAVANTFAEDGDFTNMFGIHVHGREAIEKRFAGIFQGNLKGSTRTDTVRNIRFYAPGVAFVDADTVIVGTKKADGSIGPVRKGLMIAMMTKENGRWRISNFHEAEYPDRAAPVIPAQK